ncbi:MAG: orotate phosphoribosyltransferase [Calditrichia bacterium]|nr:orotate phosphoribosyltransferase [Calditrichia bacterium]MCK5454694.1 orotate phosphoribosyltransferase [Calditrichia bacterium]
MERKEIFRIFEDTGALQTGHFLLTSGLHSPQYFQCALVLQHQNFLEKLCLDIVEYYYEEEDIDVVIAPAIGGITVGQELARQLNVRFIFTERENGKMVLRRGFRLDQHKKVLIAEDVITTGGSVKEIIDIVESVRGYPIGIGAIVDRSEGVVKFDMPLFSTIQVKAVTYEPERCPLCNQKIPLIKPGSRGIKV